MERRRHSRSRRSLLIGAGTLASSALAGCSTGAFSGSSGGAARTDGGRSAPVSVLAAGSLNDAFENGLREETDVDVQVEAHGSARLARLVAEGQRDPDVVSVADVSLFDGPLSPPWYAEFATNAIVVAYNRDTEGGRSVGRAGSEHWYEPLLDGRVNLGRTDPDLDPLGYRTLFCLELAARYYDGAPNLRRRVPKREQIYPETQLVSGFETGSIDAAFTYRNMAAERGYDFLTLPPEIDLSDPARTDDWYATVSYRLPDGKRVAGRPISYGSTVRHPTDAAVSVFETQLAGEYLEEFGFTVPSNYPQYTGEVPSDLDG